MLQTDQFIKINNQDEEQIVETKTTPRCSRKRVLKLFVISCLCLIAVGLWTSNGGEKAIQVVKSDIKEQQIKQSIKQPSESNNEPSQEEVQAIIREALKNLKARPFNKTAEPSHTFKPTQKAYFAYGLHENPNSITHILAEQMHYEQQYKIYSKALPEQPLCIASVGRNLIFQDRYQKFIMSIARQNYTNYHVVFVDDYSSDGTVKAMKQFLESLKKRNQSIEVKKQGKLKMSESEQLRQLLQIRTMKDKFHIIENNERKYALANKNMAIRDHCRSGDIVVQVDADDQLIGRQAFKFISHIYSSDPSIWIFYSNYLRWNSAHSQPSEGISQKIPQIILQRNTYRQSTTWLTSATRTFLRSVFMEIDESDFLMKSQNGSNSFYKWTSDLFMHYSLVELAGPKHYRFINQLFYYYYLTHNSENAKEKQIDRLRSLQITPYLPLEDLQVWNDASKENGVHRRSRKIQNYTAEQWIETNIKKLQEEISKEKQSS